MRTWSTTRLLCAALAGWLCACGDDAAPGTSPERASAADGEASSRTTTAGPVVATVALTPAAPRLGDTLELTLTVAVEAGVDVVMPDFGEALGRFTIVDFTPRSQTNADGSSEQVQRYSLQTPMSGHQRIPPLRIEFFDNRPGSDRDGGVLERELLTEELAVVVASVSPEGEVAAELRPARGRLDPPRIALLDRWWPALAGGAAVILLALALVIVRRRARVQTRISAYDQAIAKLAELEARGLPAAAQADAWYVTLSDIVRRYLEDRYRLRAPELTTEEFLREAQRSRELTEHRALLSAFLAECDRVKFAGYRPEQTESSASLAVARRFVEETRLTSTSSPGEEAAFQA